MKQPKFIADDPDIQPVLNRYAVGVNDHVLSLMQDENPAHDPVARQYVPLVDEMLSHPLENDDPIGDYPHTPVHGIVHRYPDRVLMKLTSICPVYCRYCFRKTMVGPSGDAIKKSDQIAAINYIKNHPEISEVILTGGDPLMLSAPRIQSVMDQLSDYDHIDVIRIHSRAIAADPGRINDEMLQALSCNKMVYMVMHINHVQEINAATEDAIARLRQAGVMMLSQSVLLQGVNDSADALRDLFKRLVRLGVKPYMLHHLDRAPGTNHFYVPIERGQAIMQDLRGHISGLCLPEYILDIPGGGGKIPLTPEYITKDKSGGYRVRDYRGKIHHYE